MATLEMRTYGALGGDGSHSAATDAATWNRAVTDAKSGDTIHVSYQAGQAVIKPPTGAANNKSGVAFAFDEAILLYPQQGSGETFAVSGKNNVVFGLGNLNGHGSGGKLGSTGKWGIMLDRRQNPVIRGDALVTRFQNCSQIHYEHCWIRSMRETLATGQTTEYASSIPCFAYVDPVGAGSAPDHIYLDHVSAVNCTYGYGLFQAASGHFLYFKSILGEGGTVLRFEQQAGENMSITDVTADGVWGVGGNCVAQFNPHQGERGSKGLQRALITHLTSEDMARTYLFDTGGGLNSGIVMDGVTVVGGAGAQIPVNAYASTTDGRPSRGWKTGSTEQLCDTGRGVYEGGGYSIKNVVYSGAFSGGGTSPPDASDWSRVADARVTSGWGAGFDDAPPPPPAVDLTVSGGAAPVATFTKSRIGPPPSTPLTDTGQVRPAGVASYSHVLGPRPAMPEWTSRPASPDPHASAYLAARALVAATWTWTVDGDVLPGAVGALQDTLSIPTPLGTHTVSVTIQDADGHQSDAQSYSWLTIEEAPPPPPVEPPLTPPPVLGLLGCGYHTAYLQPRGGGTRLGVLHHTALRYDASESQTATATITLDGVSRFGADCCHLLGMVEEWLHEVEIRRNGPVAFIGPVTKVETQGDQAVITASDLSVWFAKRRVHHGGYWEQADLTIIARDVIMDAMSTDMTPKLGVVIDAPSGILVSWTIPVGDVQLCSEVLRALVDLGLAWRVTGRTVHLGYPGQASMPTLTDEAFQDDPKVTTSGDADTNNVVVTGNNQGDTILVLGAYTDQADKALHGSLESVNDQPELSQDASSVARQAVTDGVNTIPVVEASVLSANAPVVFTDLAPLMRARLRLGGCRPLGGTYRISTRSVTEGAAGDEVSISVEPA